MTEVLYNEPQKLELCNVIYSSYTESQKKATLKYREKNRDKVNEQRKIYYKQRKENDPQFLEYKRAKSREYYQRKKHEKNNNEIELLPIINDSNPFPEEVKVEEVLSVIDSKPIEEEVIEEVKEVKEKTKRQKKPKIPELEPQPIEIKSELIEFDKTPEDEKACSTILLNAVVKPKRNSKKSKITYEV
jgi:hypothetical protein